jgi:hypothetical protein
MARIVGLGPTGDKRGLGLPRLETWRIKDLEAIENY